MDVIPSIQVNRYVLLYPYNVFVKPIKGKVDHKRWTWHHGAGTSTNYPFGRC